MDIFSKSRSLSFISILRRVSSSSFDSGESIWGKNNTHVKQRSNASPNPIRACAFEVIFQEKITVGPRYNEP